MDECLIVAGLGILHRSDQLRVKERGKPMRLEKLFRSVSSRVG